LVASQVWGHGDRGYGPHRAARVLARPDLAATLTEAVSLLVSDGACAAYDKLDAVRHLGPAFHTKFLYFAGQALPEVKGPRPLILDAVLARVLRRHATRLGRAAGLPWAPDVARRIWSPGGWTSHRYSVYLTWMSATTTHLAANLPAWPHSPDLLELALFTGAWNPAAA
jgi:hypothetical protein